MSGHADTIRRYIDANRAHGKVNAFSYTSLPLDDLDALLAENQRLRDIEALFQTALRKNQRENQRLREALDDAEARIAMKHKASEALAGDTERDASGEPLFPPGCKCSSYGHGLVMTRVTSRTCPVHGVALAGDTE